MDDFNSGKANHARHTNDKEWQIWLIHNRLGHPSFRYLQHLFPALFSTLQPSSFKCETCIVAKSHRVPYPVSHTKRDMSFSLIHSDVWEPSHAVTPSRNKWFVISIDDCTRMTWLYLLKWKDEVFGVFQSFHVMIQTQFSTKIKTLHTNNGGEYINTRFQAYFQHHGLIHETSYSQTPQQNDIAERKN